MLAAVDVTYFFPPVVLAGVAVGFVARRWIVLAVPMAVWLVSGVVWG